MSTSINHYDIEGSSFNLDKKQRQPFLAFWHEDQPNIPAHYSLGIGDSGIWLSFDRARLVELRDAINKALEQPDGQPLSKPLDQPPLAGKAAPPEELLVEAGLALKALTDTVESRFEGLEIVGLVPQDLRREVERGKRAYQAIRKWKQETTQTMTGGRAERDANGVATPCGPEREILDAPRHGLDEPGATVTVPPDANIEF